MSDLEHPALDCQRMGLALKPQPASHEHPLVVRGWIPAHEPLLPSATPGIAHHSTQNPLHRRRVSDKLLKLSLLSFARTGIDEEPSSIYKRYTWYPIYTPELASLAPHMHTDRLIYNAQSRGATTRFFASALRLLCPCASELQGAIAPRNSERDLPSRQESLRPV